MVCFKSSCFRPTLLSLGLAILSLLSLVGCKNSRHVSNLESDDGRTSQSQQTADSAHVTSQTEVAKGTDWKQFRGPDSTSVAFSSGFPTKWDESNVVWKSELVGRGASTPIIVGDKVFVTSYSGYGESAEKPGDLSKLRHHLYCFDRIGGSLILSLIHI